MGFSPKKGMGYGGQIVRPPTWWTEKSMGYESLWVIWGMSYQGFDCTRFLMVFNKRKKSTNFWCAKQAANPK